MVVTLNNFTPNFRYLNLNNTWPLFELSQGLVLQADGSLALATIPKPTVELPNSGTLTAPNGPASLSVAPDNTLYIADPDHHQILYRDACTGEILTIPCFGGEGNDVGQLQTPRGVLVGPRSSLYIADSGNHRIQVLDMATYQIRAVWGQSLLTDIPIPGDAPGQFNTPVSLVSDRAGAVYIADETRVQKFTPNGQVVEAFWQTLSTQTEVPQSPAYLAIGTLEGEERIFVLDRRLDDAQLLIYHTDGTFDPLATASWQSFSLGIPTGLAISLDKLYIGSGNRILVFSLTGQFHGSVEMGAIAGLGLDTQGNLWLHPGNGNAVIKLLPNEAYVASGSFIAGPFDIRNPAGIYHLSVLANPLAANTHVQFFTYTSANPDATPSLPAVGPTNLVADTDQWRSAPLDQFELLVLNEPADFLWIGGVLQGDKTASPQLHQMRLELVDDAWLHQLPAIYRRGGSEQAFLSRLLQLFEGIWHQEEQLINNLPKRFDPWASPDLPEVWLDWLASWLDFELDENWSEEERRDAIANAFALHTRRGTVAGLRRLIHLYSGATAFINEPAQAVTPWSLGETSTLGFNTYLALGHPQGAVVGTTATLDQSHLIHEDDYGAPLFADLAHCFCVQIYQAELNNPKTLERIRQVLDREKPAHLSYHICPIEAQMRVGMQARIDIDAIVGGSPTDWILTEGSQLGNTTVLGGPQTSSKIGHSSRVGQSTTVT